MLTSLLVDQVQTEQMEIYQILPLFEINTLKYRILILAIFSIGGYGPYDHMPNPYVHDGV